MLMDKNEKNPLAYFITFTCYGARLHGNRKGTVDINHNTFDTPYMKHNVNLNEYEKNIMSSKVYLLNHKRRGIVLSSIQETCIYFNWHLFAVHVRSNHVHCVVNGEKPPEFIMHQFKSRSSKALNLTEPRQKRWTKHGSTRYLFSSPFLFAAMRYVVYEQGEPMSVYKDESCDLDA